MHLQMLICGRAIRHILVMQHVWLDCSSVQLTAVAAEAMTFLPVQVYLDQMHDLLWAGGPSVPRPKLEVRQGPHGSHLPGLTEHQVRTLHVSAPT